MKQHITRKQWEELSFQQRADFWGKENDSWNETILEDKYPSIGQMIEFLGDSWMTLLEDEDHVLDLIKNTELCDVLWEACKYKLKICF